ncbi:hypothetical protein AAZX31_10G045400 [Glycine max]
MSGVLHASVLVSDTDTTLVLHFICWILLVSTCPCRYFIDHNTRLLRFGTPSKSLSSDASKSDELKRKAS